MTAFTPAAWMMLTGLLLGSPTNLRAYGADDDKAHPAISVLYSVRVTLTNHYWVTSDERRRLRGKTAFPNAYEVKALSPHHRFVIALHSPGAVAETGLRVCPPEKNARKLARDVRRATFSSAV